MRKFVLSLALPAILLSLWGCCVKQQQEPQRVNNVILMIGDGMGMGHVTQLIVEKGAEPVAMDRAQAVGLVRTFSANNRVTDSAAAGTAIATGSKTNNAMVGRDPRGNDLHSILSDAQKAGYPTGLVVTVDLFDATPGAFYAHVHDRDSRDTITLQLLDSGIDVAIGGGRRYLDERADGRVLTDEFREKGYSVAFGMNEVEKVSDGKLLAVLAPEVMPYSTDGRGDYLPRATSKALEILSADHEQRGSRGFFLMVEGSLIDYAAHDHLSKELGGELLDFEKAVGVAFDYADLNPGTLVIVTADHETGGLTIPSNDSDFQAGESGVGYHFSTGSHTASLVPLFAYGTGAQEFSRTLDNTEISGIIARLTEFTK